MSKIAILFPGQGSQSIGMGLELSAQYKVAKDTLEEASDALGLDLSSLLKDGPEAELNRTDITQPAILAVSVATWRVIQQETALSASYMAGHSLGEYSALVCSGAIDFSDALKLVNRRGELMLQAVPEGTGGMAAILGLADEDIQKACDMAADGEVVAPVNFNSPGQVVIAGHKAAVDRAGQACLDSGAKKVVPLAVSVPSHCALMQPAAEQLQHSLEAITLSTPNIPVINNVDVTSQADTVAIKDALIKQLYSPVRWSETIQWFEANGVTTYVECGPGKVLAGLNKRINRRSVVYVSNDLAGVTKLVESVES